MASCTKMKCETLKHTHQLPPVLDELRDFIIIFSEILDMDSSMCVDVPIPTVCKDSTWIKVNKLEKLQDFFQNIVGENYVVCKFRYHAYVLSRSGEGGGGEDAWSGGVLGAGEMTARFFETTLFSWDNRINIVNRQITKSAAPTDQGKIVRQLHKFWDNHHFLWDNQGIAYSLIFLLLFLNFLGAWGVRGRWSVAQNINFCQFVHFLGKSN